MEPKDISLWSEILNEDICALLSNMSPKDEDLLEIIASDKGCNIWIFGAAGIGISIKRYLERRNFAIYAFCDNNEEKVGTIVDGVQVRSFLELCQDQNKIVLLAVWKYFDEIACQCKTAGIQFFDAALLSGVVFDTIKESASFISQNTNKILEICANLADEQSKQIYLISQIARISRARGAMVPYKSDTQYIEPNIITPDVCETIFLCGTGDGSSAIELFQNVGGTAKIYAFEPDPLNFSRLCGTVKGMKNIHCIECGIGRKSEMLPFCGGMGDNSTFSAEGDRTVQVTSVDDYVESCGVIPTYITMDIEGWEMEALYGAKKTIAQYRPKLAISLYHRASDFVNIPEFILNLRPDYQIYVRHYTDSYSDTIAYFV